MIIEQLPKSRWQEGRDLRLEALQNDRLAFGSSFEEENKLSDTTWQDRMSNAWFAQEDNELMGMIVLIGNPQLKARHVANIFGLYVKSAFRGNGVGRELMTFGIQWAKENQFIKINLTVNTEQASAISLYEQLGFRIVGTLQKELYYQQEYYDERIMELIFDVSKEDKEQT